MNELESLKQAVKEKNLLIANQIEELLASQNAIKSALLIMEKIDENQSLPFKESIQ